MLKLVEEFMDVHLLFFWKLIEVDVEWWHGGDTLIPL